MAQLRGDLIKSRLDRSSHIVRLRLAFYLMRSRLRRIVCHVRSRFQVSGDRFSSKCRRLKRRLNGPQLVSLAM